MPSVELVVASSTSKIRTPTQHRAVHTRLALLDAAERELARRGYVETTAKTIAERAKVATGSFYQYFASKDDALHEIARMRYTDVIEHVLDALAGTRDFHDDHDAVVRDVRKRMRGIVAVTLAYHVTYRGLQAVFAERRHVDRALDAVLREGERRVIDRVAELMVRWGHRGDVEAKAYVLFNAARGAIHAHVIGGAAVDDDRFTAATVDALIRIALPAR
jgi:AcrR family transcriptional regulator